VRTLFAGHLPESDNRTLVERYVLIDFFYRPLHLKSSLNYLWKLAMSFTRTTESFRSEQTYTFQPKDDITAYEIAQLLPVLIAAWRDAPDGYAISRKEIPSSWAANVESLSESLQRHFIKSK